MRRVKYEVGAVKVLVDIPEEMFKVLQQQLPSKLKQSIAALAVQAINVSLKGSHETNQTIERTGQGRSDDRGPDQTEQEDQD